MTRELHGAGRPVGRGPSGRGPDEPVPARPVEPTREVPIEESDTGRARTEEIHSGDEQSPPAEIRLLEPSAPAPHRDIWFAPLTAHEARLVCLDCGNTFIKPWRCATCGAQKLYGATLASACAERDQARAALRLALPLLETWCPRSIPEYGAAIDAARAALSIQLDNHDGKA